MAKTYRQVHDGLHWERGPASSYTCVECLVKPAKHWAYLYTASKTALVDEDGSPYSENLNDYAPMCIGCHRAFDIRMDPERNVISPAARIAFLQPERVRARIAKREAGYATSPERQEARRAAMSAIATQTNGQRIKCSCGLVSTPAGMGTHRKSSGHG